jgi:hypothetical protein
MNNDNLKEPMIDNIKQNIKAMDDALLDKKTTELLQEIAPQRDLWPGIERAINHQSQQSSVFKSSDLFIPSVWAASVAMIMLVSWLTLAPQHNPFNETRLVSHSTESKANQAQLIIMMQQSFNQQKVSLRNSYGNPKVELLPIAMQTELSQLAKARVAIKNALDNDENNVDLLNLLDFTQQQELKLLQQLYRQYPVI